MRGQRTAEAAVDRRGLVGDRQWAVADGEGKFGSCKNTRRFRRMDGLLDFTASYPHDGADPADRTPQILAPDGTRHAVPSESADDAVRAHLGRSDVRIGPEAGIPHHDGARCTWCRPPPWTGTGRRWAASPPTSAGCG